MSRFILIIQRQKTLIHSMKSQSFLFLFHNNGFGAVNGFLVYVLYLSQYKAVNMYWEDEANLATLLRSLVWGGKESKGNTQKQETRCLLGADRGFAPPPPDATFSSLLSSDYIVFWPPRCPLGVARKTLSGGLSFCFVFMLDFVFFCRWSRSSHHEH